MENLQKHVNSSLSLCEKKEFLHKFLQELLQEFIHKFFQKFRQALLHAFFQDISKNFFWKILMDSLEIFQGIHWKLLQIFL